MKRTLFLFFFFLLTLFFSPVHAQEGGMDKFMGTNYLRDSPINYLDAVGFAREYHSWHTVERCSPESSHIGSLDCEDGPRPFTTGENTYYFNPSFIGTGILSYDAMYSAIPPGVTTYPSAEGIISDVGYPICGTGPGNLGNIDHDGVPVFPHGANSVLAESYAWHADFCTQYVIKYGNPTPVYQNYAKIGEVGNEEEIGLNLHGGGEGVKYFENYNEHDKFWAAGNNNTIITPCESSFPGISQGVQFSPEEYAIMSSTDYDGYDPSSPTGYVMSKQRNGNGQEYPVGINHVDESVQFVMSGMTDILPAHIDYVNQMKNHMVTHRSGQQKEFVFDILNFHHYSYSNPLNPNAAGKRDRHGISPEEEGLYSFLKAAREQLDPEIRNLPLWLTEFGYDTNPYSDLAALPDIQMMINGTSLDLRERSASIDTDESGTYQDNILNFRLMWNPNNLFNNTGNGYQMTVDERDAVMNVMELAQAQWLLRSYLIIAAADWQKAFQYRVADENTVLNPLLDVNNNIIDPSLSPSGYRFLSAGLTTDINQGFVRKLSYFFTKTMHDVLGTRTVDFESGDGSIRVKNDVTSNFDTYSFEESSTQTLSFEKALNDAIQSNPEDNPICLTSNKTVALLNFSGTEANGMDDITVVWSPSHCNKAEFLKQMEFESPSVYYRKINEATGLLGEPIFMGDCNPDTDVCSVSVPVCETPIFIFRSELPAPISCLNATTTLSDCNTIGIQIDAQGQVYDTYEIFYSLSDETEGCGPLTLASNSQSVIYTDDLQNFNINGLDDNEDYDIWIIGYTAEDGPVVTEHDGMQCPCLEGATLTIDEMPDPCGLPVFTSMFDEGTMQSPLEFPNELFDSPLTSPDGCDYDPIPGDNDFGIGQIYDSFSVIPGSPPTIPSAFVDLDDCFQLNQISLWDGRGTDIFEIMYTTDDVISATTTWLPLFEPHYITETYEMWVYEQVAPTITARHLRITPLIGGLPQSPAEYTEALIGEMRICGVLDANFTTDINCLEVDFTPNYQWANPNTTHEWDFGDPASGADNISTSADPTHNFSGMNTYTVTHTLTHTYPTDPTEVVSYSVTMDVVVTGDGETFTTSFTSELDACNVLTLTSTSDASEGAIYEWSVGGIIQDETDPEIEVEGLSEGTYPVTLTITSGDNCGESEPAESELTIEADIVEIATFVPPIITCFDVTIESDDPGGEVTHSWIVTNQSTGAEITGDQEDISIVGLAPGMYDVVHSVTDLCGNTSEPATGTFEIEDTPIDASFTTTENCEEGTVTFDTPFPDSDYTHSWTINGVLFNDVSNPVVNFDNTGPHTIVHTLSHPCFDESVEVNISDFFLEEDCFDLPACCPAGSILIEDMTFQEAIDAGLMLPRIESAPNPQKLCISGTLTYDNPNGDLYDYWFAPGSEILMLEGAAIEIKDLSQLHIIGSHIYGCDFMHRGIVLDGVVSLLEINNSLIEDAEFAVSATAATALGGDGMHSGLRINNNSIFRNNHIGIFLPEESEVLLLKFRENTFTSDGDMLLTYEGQDLVPLDKSYAGVLFEDHSPISLTSNTFSNMYNGIIVKDTDLFSTENTFINLNSGSVFFSSIEGYGIHGEGNSNFLAHEGDLSWDFVNCEKGIKLSGMGAEITNTQMNDVDEGIFMKGNSGEITIQDNDINAFKRGISLGYNADVTSMLVDNNIVNITGNPLIELSGSGISVGEINSVVYPDAVISNNNISINDRNIGIGISNVDGIRVLENTINMDNGEENYAGISISHCLNSQISDNTIVGTGVAPTIDPMNPPNNVGLYVISSENVDYTCNVLDQLNTGAKFSMMCTNTQLATTQFYDCGIGLHLNETAFFTSENTDPITGTFNIQNHNGNIWLGGYSEVAARIDGLPQNYRYSQFRINDTSTDLYPPSFLPENDPTNEASWFFAEDGDTNDDCEAIIGLTGGGIGHLDIMIAKDSLYFELFEEGKKYLAQQYLYRKLLSNPDLLGVNIDIDNFFAIMNASVRGELEDLNDAKKILHHLDAETKTEIEENRTLIKNFMTQIEILENQLSSNPSEEELASFRTEKEIILQLLKDVDVAQKELMAAIEAVRNSEADWVKSDNGLIYTSKLMEINEKTVNNIYLSTAAKGVLEFADEQISQLTIIALQCPVEGGDAVFTARNLLEYHGIYEIYDDESLCNAAGIQLNITPDTGADIAMTNTGEGENGIINTEEGVTEILNIRGSHDDKRGFSVYPNPASDKLNIICPEFSSKQFFIIHDIYGRELFNQEIMGKTELMIDNWESGVYFVRITDETNYEIWSDKVIIIK